MEDGFLAVFASDGGVGALSVMAISSVAGGRAGTRDLGIISADLH